MAISNITLPVIPGYVEDEYEGSRVYKRLSDDRLFNPDLTPIVPYTPAELRELAYETHKCVEFEGQMLTVDEAEKKFWQYYPDNSKSSIAEELRTLISDAKDDIRQEYPDENEEN